MSSRSCCALTCRWACLVKRSAPAASPPLSPTTTPSCAGASCSRATSSLCTPAPSTRWVGRTRGQRCFQEALARATPRALCHRQASTRKGTGQHSKPEIANPKHARHPPVLQAVGFDAVMLMEHAGLQATSAHHGSPRCSLPPSSLRRTLTQLVDAGHTVVGGSQAPRTFALLSCPAAARRRGFQPCMQRHPSPPLLSRAGGHRVRGRRVQDDPAGARAGRRRVQCAAGLPARPAGGRAQRHTRQQRSRRCGGAHRGARHRQVVGGRAWFCGLAGGRSRFCGLLSSRAHAFVGRRGRGGALHEPALCAAFSARTCTIPLCRRLCLAVRRDRACARPVAPDARDAACPVAGRRVGGHRCARADAAPPAAQAAGRRCGEGLLALATGIPQHATPPVWRSCHSSNTLA